MNIIYDLLNEEYVLAYLRKRVLPKYPQFSDIESLTIRKHKKNIWETTYHVVFEYRTVFIDYYGVKRILPIFVSAHSEEPRREAYEAMKYLRSHGLTERGFDLPHPLYYSQRFGAVFYRGVEGENLYYYIKLGEKTIVKDLVKKTAGFLAELYKLDVNDSPNFNPLNSRIKTVIPGSEQVLIAVKDQYPDYYTNYKELYDYFIATEQDFLNNHQRKYLTHGDFHPENIIKSPKGMGVIDFTDICLSDFARDLGCFTQQLDYMIGRKMNDLEFAEEMKKLFLDTFISITKVELTDDLRKRIANYYAWTSIRTASFFLMKYQPEPERAKAVLEKAKQILQ